MAEKQSAIDRTLRTVSMQLLKISYGLVEEARRLDSAGGAPQLDSMIHDLNHQVTKLKLAQELGKGNER